MTTRDYRVGDLWRTIDAGSASSRGENMSAVWADTTVLIVERALGSVTIQRIDWKGDRIATPSLITDSVADWVLNHRERPEPLPKFQSVEEANQWLTRQEQE